jgi:hypothetical protein
MRLVKRSRREPAGDREQQVQCGSDGTGVAADKATTRMLRSSIPSHAARPRRLERLYRHHTNSLSSSSPLTESASAAASASRLGSSFGNQPYTRKSTVRSPKLPRST